MAEREEGETQHFGPSPNARIFLLPEQLLQAPAGGWALVVCGLLDKPLSLPPLYPPSVGSYAQLIVTWGSGGAFEPMAPGVLGCPLSVTLGLTTRSSSFLHHLGPREPALGGPEYSDGIRLWWQRHKARWGLT